jgi:hypothetical protein
MHRDRSQMAAGTGFAKFRETRAGTPISDEETTIWNQSGTIRMM